MNHNISDTSKVLLAYSKEENWDTYLDGEEEDLYYNNLCPPCKKSFNTKGWPFFPLVSCKNKECSNH